jgi:hypothetical protein
MKVIFMKHMVVADGSHSLGLKSKRYLLNDTQYACLTIRPTTKSKK